jgi:hypothetical protein
MVQRQIPLHLLWPGHVKGPFPSRANRQTARRCVSVAAFVVRLSPTSSLDPCSEEVPGMHQGVASRYSKRVVPRGFRMFLHFPGKSWIIGKCLFAKLQQSWSFIASKSPEQRKIQIRSFGPIQWWLRIPAHQILQVTSLGPPQVFNKSQVLISTPDKTRPDRDF